MSAKQQAGSVHLGQASRLATGLVCGAAEGTTNQPPASLQPSPGPPRPGLSCLAKATAWKRKKKKDDIEGMWKYREKI